MKIGFFDSGLGGLMVMNYVSEKLPYHEYVFLGDTKHLPYGPRDVEEITELSFPCLLHLLEEEHCNVVVVACNTVSVKALHIFKEKFPQYKDRVMGIDELTLEHFDENKEGLITLCTLQTKRSQRYEDISSHVIAMPGLVELIENNDLQTSLALCDDVLGYHHHGNTILLGCTHYLWLKEALSKKYPSLGIVGQDHLVYKKLASLEKDVYSTQYLLTSDPENYQKKYGKDFKLIEIDR